MRLQYAAMNSMGETWIDCQDRYDEFVSRACKYLNLNKKEIEEQLYNGATIEWPGALHAKIRDQDSIMQRTLPVADTWDENELWEEGE